MDISSSAFSSRCYKHNLYELLLEELRISISCLRIFLLSFSPSFVIIDLLRFTRHCGPKIIYIYIYERLKITRKQQENWKNSIRILHSILPLFKIGRKENWNTQMRSKFYSNLDDSLFILTEKIGHLFHFAQNSKLKDPLYQYFHNTERKLKRTYIFRAKTFYLTIITIVFQKIENYSKPPYILSCPGILNIHATPTPKNPSLHPPCRAPRTQTPAIHM